VVASTYFLREGGTAPWPRPGEALPLLPAFIATLILAASSACASESEGSLRRGHPEMSRRWVAFTVLLGSLFLALQAWEWTDLFTRARELSADPAVPFGRNPWGAPSFVQSFLLASGLHGAHVLLGLALLVWLGRRLRGDAGPAEVRLTSGVTLYWHFVDVVWLFLFTALYLL
jgi:cytochrome c oxidase subunit 3